MPDAMIETLLGVLVSVSVTSCYIAELLMKRHMEKFLELYWA